MTHAAPSLSQDFAIGSPPMTALRALFLVCLHHGVTLPVTDLPDFAGQDDFAPRIEAVLQRLGFRSQLMARGGWRMAARLGSAYPALCEGRDGGWFILVHVIDRPDGPQAAILDPAREADGIQLIPRADFLQRWTASDAGPAGQAVEQARAPFGLRWFLPAVRDQAGLLAGVGVAVIASNLIAFALPFLFQVMIDKVIAYGA